MLLNPPQTSAIPVERGLAEGFRMHVLILGISGVPAPRFFPSDHPVEYS
jgi:hypothetical protein